MRGGFFDSVEAGGGDQVCAGIGALDLAEMDQANFGAGDCVMDTRITKGGHFDGALVFVHRLERIVIGRVAGEFCDGVVEG